jgi:hypothetical protein
MNLHGTILFSVGRKNLTVYSEDKDGREADDNDDEATTTVGEEARSVDARIKVGKGCLIIGVAGGDALGALSSTEAGVGDEAGGAGSILASAA